MTEKSRDSRLTLSCSIELLIFVVQQWYDTATIDTSIARKMKRNKRDVDECVGDVIMPAFAPLCAIISPAQLPTHQPKQLGVALGRILNIEKFQTATKIFSPPDIGTGYGLPENRKSPQITANQPQINRKSPQISIM